VRDEVPVLPDAIANRVNEITFNASLIAELRAIAFVQKLVEDGWLKVEKRSQLRYIRVHAIRADRALGDLSEASKFALDGPFLATLRDRGRDMAAAWLDETRSALGRRSSVDIRAEYLDGTTLTPAPVEPSPKKRRGPRGAPSGKAKSAPVARKVKRRSSTRNRKSTARSGS
jgi:NTE family protein